MTFARRPDLDSDNRTYRRRRIPRITPAPGTTQLDSRPEQFRPPPVPEKTTHTVPQLISTPRDRRPHQTDQQSEHHIVITVNDALVRIDQPTLIGKSRTKLSQLTQKPPPTRIQTHDAPAPVHLTAKNPRTDDNGRTPKPFTLDTCSPQLPKRVRVKPAPLMAFEDHHRESVSNCPQKERFSRSGGTGHEVPRQGWQLSVRRSSPNYRAGDSPRTSGVRSRRLCQPPAPMTFACPRLRPSSFSVRCIP